MGGPFISSHPVFEYLGFGMLSDHPLIQLEIENFITLYLKSIYILDRDCAPLNRIAATMFRREATFNSGVIFLVCDLIGFRRIMSFH